MKGRPTLHTRLLAAGKCPACSGAEDLLPGLQYGPVCRAKQCAAGKARRIQQRQAPATLTPEQSVWDLPLDGLALAIREAEADLEIA